MVMRLYGHHISLEVNVVSKGMNIYLQIFKHSVAIKTGWLDSLARSIYASLHGLANQKLLSHSNISKYRKIWE